MKCSIVFHRPGNILRVVALLTVALACAGTPALAQFRPVAGSKFPDFDSRAPAAPKVERLSERQGAQSHLVQQLPSVAVDFDPLLGSPKFIRAYDGFLTGPNGQGRSVSATALQALPTTDPLRPIKAFLNEHSALFGHGAEVLDAARVQRDYVDAHNGLRTIAWEQQLEGIPLFQSVLLAHVTKKGELTSLSSRFLPDLAIAADTGTPGRTAIQSAPPISALQAILLAGQNVEGGLKASNIVATGGAVGGYLLYQTPQQASVRQVWFPLHRSALRFAWEVFVTGSASHESFQVVVDAQTGKVLLRKNLTCHISDATYSVYDSYSPSPYGPSLQVPGTFQPALSNRVVIVTSALDTIASPDGWIPDGSNTTTGNNVDAFLDRNDDEQPDQARPLGNPNRVFSFPLDLTMDPTNYIDGSTVQLFWRGNWYHDRLYQLGFTEAAGNYQDNTFGRGGLGNDHVIAFVQSGADVGQTDNSMFAPAPDGQNGRCYMFIFTGPTPYRDGSLDQEVVIHEFTHGTSWRLVGGGGMVLGSLQGDGMGEGWSDYYAEALLSPTNSNPDAAYATGGYVTYQLGGMDQNYYYGIRRYPYCTDMMKNPLTFKDIDPNQADAHKGVPMSPLFSPFDSGSADEVHNQGEVWCVTLWEMHANLVRKYGWAKGNELALQLATDGMKLTPAFPNFLQARDAIILADTIDNGGANLAEIWSAFAKRGMGFSATSPDGRTTAGVQEAYDVPNVSALAIYLDHFQIFGGNGNGIIDFNECNDLNLILTNRGNVDATRVSATLTTTTPNVAIAQPVSPYPDMPAGVAATNLQPFKVSTSRSFVPGTPIEFSLFVRCDQGLAISRFTIASGVPGNPLRFDNNSPVFIPSPGAGSSSILVSNVTFAVNNVTVSMFVEESFDFFLQLELIAPDGTTNLLSANNGLFGQNYGTDCGFESQRTTFDDASSTPISSGAAPFVGSFRPDQPLSVFDGKSGTNANGIWRLRAIDQGQFDSVAINCWSLFITPTLSTDGGGQCPGADFALGMKTLPDPVIVGNNLTYIITVTNNGPSIATNAIVTLIIPGSVIVVSSSTSQGTYSQQGDVVTFNLGLMGIRDEATMTVVAMPTVPGTLLSTASVVSEQPDFVPSNNSVTVATHVRPPTADLSLTMAAVPNPVLVGGTLTYTVSLTNNGSSSATAITVTNALPSSARIQSVAITQGTTNFVGNVILWDLPSLAMGASATAVITVIPTAEGLITATATVGAPEFDPVTQNNTARVTTTVGPAADLSLSLIGLPDTVVTGSSVTYTLAVSNLGPSTATSVVVNDSLPANVTVRSANTTQGTTTISNSTLIWTVGTLSNAAGAGLTIIASTAASGTLSSTATILATQADSNPSNNTATVTTIVAPPFVSVVAAGAVLTSESGPVNGAINVGETVTLVMRLRNAGNVAVSNLVATLLTTNGVAPVPPNTPQVFTNLAPSGFAVGCPFSFVASGTNGGTVSPVLQLQAGTNTYPPVSFTFTLPSTATFANTNAILVPDPATPNPPYAAGAGPARPYPSVITVTNFVGLLGKVSVTLSNLSHTFPGDVNVLLVAPGGAKSLIMSHAGSQPMTPTVLTFDDTAASLLPADGVLTAGTYQPTAYSPAIRLGGFPTNAPAGPYPTVLSALNGVNPNGDWLLYVFDDSAGDVGSIANGWSLALTMLTPVNQVADLGLTALAAPNPCLAGGKLTYNFTITNNGPNTANSVTFTNTLPTGVNLISAHSSQGSVVMSASRVVANIGSLNAGAIVTVTNVGIVTTAAIPQGMTTATLTSVANVTALENDLNPVNNGVSVVTTANRPVADLGLVQRVAPDPVVVGYSLTNTVAITNRGPGIALDVILTEPLPPTVGFVANSSSTSVGMITNPNGVVTCSLGDLAPNAAATVTIVLTNSAVGRMTNAVFLSSGSYDPISTNNSATYVATVVSPSPQIINAGALLTYESGPVNGAVDPGENVTLSLALANIGSLDTVNLKATLQSAGGVTAPSSPQYYGALAYGGPSSARSFSFKAAAAPGSAVVATLQLQDEQPGATIILPAVTFTFASPTATSYSAATAISIPNQGVATPYPSIINISGLTGRVSQATVTLNGLTHAFPHDVNVLLVSPAGSNVLVMSHTGGGHPVSAINLTFDDTATNTLPNYDPITGGTYKPSSYEGPVTLPSTASPKSYQFALSAFNWSNPNGAWSLFVYDDFAGDAGSIASGWSLNLNTLVTVGPVVDLAVSLAVPATLNVGSALTNTISFSNPGPDTATGVIFTNTLPLGASFVSVSLSQGNLIGSGDGAVTCNLGNIAAGGSAQAVIVSMPPTTGSFVNAVSAGANEEDLNPANNSAQATTTVSTPTILTGYFADGQFHLTVTAEPGMYVVQGSTNLTSWVSLSTNNTTTGTFNYTDTTAPAPASRFYRTQRQ